jgi:hypothetical protein
VMGWRDMSLVALMVLALILVALLAQTLWG